VNIFIKYWRIYTSSIILIIGEILAFGVYK